MSLLIKCRILDTLDDGVIATLLKQSISASSILRVEPKNKGGEGNPGEAANRGCRTEIWHLIMEE